MGFFITEYENIGEPKEWGVLPVRPMGATVRMTKDKRILIRNTAEVHSPFKMSSFISTNHFAFDEFP